MDEVTVISYPGSKNDSLLSLTESRSRYMLPFGGKFRIIDFTIRNSFSFGARRTIIYSSFEDDLKEYVDKYGPFDEKFPPIKVVSREYSDINFCYNLILDSNTDYYIIYNGDAPSIINFSTIIKKFKRKKTGALLFRLNINGRPSMAYKLLVVDQKTILNVINEAIEEKRESPNIFEMIINIMVNKGIQNSSFNAYYWPINNIPEYFDLHREVIWNPEIFNLIYKEKIIKSQINSTGYAYVGKKAKIKNSFVSDFCNIHGTVENSIIYPGVEIGENSIVRDSIILPFVKIGSGARIIRSIIDERTDMNDQVNYYNIGNTCKIGSNDEFIKNSDFPKSLFSSITLIGKDCKISEGASIGGGCYVASGVGEEFFLTRKYLYDGLSLVR